NFLLVLNSTFRFFSARARLLRTALSIFMILAIAQKFFKITDKWNCPIPAMDIILFKGPVLPHFCCAPLFFIFYQGIQIGSFLSVLLMEIDLIPSEPPIMQ